MYILWWFYVYLHVLCILLNFYVFYILYMGFTYIVLTSLNYLITFVIFLGSIHVSVNANPIVLISP